MFIPDSRVCIGRTYAYNIFKPYQIIIHFGNFFASDLILTFIFAFPCPKN